MMEAISIVLSTVSLVAVVVAVGLHRQAARTTGGRRMSDEDKVRDAYEQGHKNALSSIGKKHWRTGQAVVSLPSPAWIDRPGGRKTLRMVIEMDQGVAAWMSHGSNPGDPLLEAIEKAALEASLEIRPDGGNP